MSTIDPLTGPKALGAFLRAHRERTTPEMVGLPKSPRRRTSGLRREELAQISGISTTWYTWIEQGREVSISAATLGRLAQALRLQPAEQEYLFSLAGIKDPQARATGVNPDEYLAQCVHQLGCPGYLLDSCWNMLAWNVQTEQLFHGWLEQDPQPNLLRFMFLHPLARTLLVNWDARAKRIVAEFRAETSHFAHSEDIRQLVLSLRDESSVFNQWWAQQEVLSREGGERRFMHPIKGAVRYRQQTFFPAGNNELKLVILVEQPFDLEKSIGLPVPD
ncbi:helix-turn-helix transcriptional regulator [Serratia sp. M24T3]|uniref:helix-turn-helix transcriptional regulator n=1 Tax=Serratia sp. M24T3 TaxID=932213 RepID=UPI00025B98BD|nr:helix-turn-helix transcriptional regulator [Serratia sp. M24T3]EIC84430.1 helix-turn-helix domain-containing protein [Serratia sp. M24T3]